MLEMHKLTRYEYAPVLKFGPGFNADKDAGELASWLANFHEDKGRPPKRLSFTFHAANDNADDVCQFMKACVSLPEVASVLSGLKVELVFAGAMSDDVAAQAHERILHQRF